MTVADEHIKHHQHVQALYEEYFKDVKGIEVHAQPASGEYDSNYWLCTIVLDSLLKVKGQENAYKTVVKGYWGTTKPIDDDAIRSFPKNGNDHAVYAICKRAACDILEHEKIAESFEPCIFRHFMVYGWHPDAYYYLNGEKRMLPWRYMIRRCINGLDIEVYGDASRKKELLYIKDFTAAVVRAANTHICGIFNLPGYKPYSLDEMVDGIMNAFASKDAKKIHRTDMPDTPQILLSGEKSKKILGWSPKWTWEDACNDMRKECIENPIEMMWGKIEKDDTIKKS